MNLRFSPAALLFLSAPWLFATPLRAAVWAQSAQDGLRAVSAGAAHQSGMSFPGVSDDFSPSARTLWKGEGGAADVENGGMIPLPEGEAFDRAVLP